MDPARDESLIFELLDLKLDVADNGSATWFLQDLASEQDAEGAMVINLTFIFSFLDIFSKCSSLEDFFLFTLLYLHKQESCALAGEDIFWMLKNET